MVRPENIRSKVAALRLYLTLLERYQNLPIEDVRSNPDLKGATERYLYLAAQATIDCAEMLVKVLSLGRPETMSENFDLLSQAGVLDLMLTEQLKKMVAFRNILSHGYERLDFQVVEVVLKNRLVDLAAFASLVEQRIMKLC